MTEQWFATHAAGFGPLVMRLAERDFPGRAAIADGDNAVRLTASGGGAAVGAPLKLLAYCRGLFRVLAEAPGGLERASRAIARDPQAEATLSSRGFGGAGGFGGRPDSRGRPESRGGTGVGSRDRRPTFVLRSFGPDDPASLPRDTRAALEELIARRTGARPDSERPEREYRLQERADGNVLFLERVNAARGSGNSSQRDELQSESTRRDDSPRRGELPRTTCRLLAEMSQPEAGDVFLDPFCGYGGIALERALAAPYRFVFASDIDAEKVVDMKAALAGKAFEKRRKTIFPKVRDALDSAAFEAGFVTTIATDPPWGLYEGGPAAASAGELLSAFLAEAARLLSPGGRLVLLVARSIDPEGPAVAPLGPGKPGFVLRESLDVLVSGKKARALRYDRE